MLVLAGHTMRTTGGWLSGWISSIVTVSAPLMVPWARMVDWDKAELAFRLGPVSESLAPDGPDLSHRNRVTDAHT
jgi:hypothetical protein